MGKILFQAIPINLSYRNRGYVARSQTQKKEKDPAKRQTVVKDTWNGTTNKEVTILINKIIEYSPMKMRAKPPPRILH